MSGVGLHGIEDFGTDVVGSYIECGITCHLTPGCESIKWNPSSKQCQKLGHLTMSRAEYKSTEWQLFSRYKYHNYTAA